MWIDAIFDRVQADITNKTAKGHYNFNDLNRIESNSEILALDLGLILTFKTDWLTTDFPLATDIQRILDNVVAIRVAYYVYDDAPDNPVMPINEFNKANALERILNDVHSIFELNKDVFYYTSEIFAGEDIGVM